MLHQNGKGGVHSCQVTPNSRYLLHADTASLLTIFVYPEYLIISGLGNLRFEEFRRCRGITRPRHLILPGLWNRNGVCLVAN